MKRGKLGRKPAVHDKRTFSFQDYLKPRLLPVAPKITNWDRAVKSWEMFGNDIHGDCTVAAMAHMVEAWTANAQNVEALVTDDEVLNVYEAVGGYKPGDDSTDNGAVMLDCLKYWRNTGLAGHKIEAFASVSPHNDVLVRDAIWLTGGLYIGLALPRSIETQRTWDIPPGGPHGDGAPGSDGGHCVCIVDYDAYGLTVVTWGALQRMTWSFFRTYTEESYAILTNDFLNGGKAPNGFDSAQLAADLKAL